MTTALDRIGSAISILRAAIDGGGLQVLDARLQRSLLAFLERSYMEVQRGASR